MPTNRPADLLVVKERGPIVELHDGTLFPATAQVTVIPSVKDATALDLYLEVDDGDVVLSNVVIGRSRDGALLTTALLRTIDLDALRREAVRALAYAVEHRARQPLRPDDHGFLEAFEGPDDRARRRRRVDDQFLKRVAAIYREAAPGGAPTRAVKDRLYATQRTASRWVKLARERGFLES